MATFWSIYLVSTNTHQVNVHLIDIQWNFANSLTAAAQLQLVQLLLQDTWAASVWKKTLLEWHILPNIENSLNNIAMKPFLLIVSHTTMTKAVWQFVAEERCYLPMSLIGCLTPISLFTVIMDTRMVSGLIVASSSCQQQLLAS